MCRILRQQTKASVEWANLKPVASPRRRWGEVPSEPYVPEEADLVVAPRGPGSPGRFAPPGDEAAASARSHRGEQTEGDWTSIREALWTTVGIAGELDTNCAIVGGIVGQKPKGQDNR